MQNDIFTIEEMSNLDYYDSGVVFFDDCYELEDADNILANKKAKTQDISILKIDCSQKIAIFKDSKSKICYTSLQGCSCRAFQDEWQPCKHMFKLAQELKIIDAETGVLLTPQKEARICSENSVAYKRNEPASTVGIAKRCKNCNAVVDYDRKVCPHCAKSPDILQRINNDFSFENFKSKSNNVQYFQVAAFVFVLFIVFAVLRAL